MTTRRKLFIAFGAGVFAAPLAAFAQRQPGKIPRVAYASGRNGPPDPSRDAIQQGLRELGYVEGKTIQFESHYFGERMDQMPGVVAKLVPKLDIVISATPQVIFAAKKATSTVPIVIVFSQDPVQAGLVASLARPGGNITGITRLLRELSGKRLELLKDVIPGLARVGVLWNADDSMSAQGLKEYATAARALKIELVSLEVRRSKPDLEGAFQAAVKSKAGALVVVRNTLLLGYASRIAELAIKHRLPSMYEGAEFIDAGGLVSYSPNDNESFKRAAVFVDKILRGTKPADLPIEQPTQFDLVINMKTAKAIGLVISKDLLLRADRVIE